MKCPGAVTPERLARELLNTHTAATASDIASTQMRAVRSHTYMKILRAGNLAVICLVRWVVFEVLPLPMSTTGYPVVGVACRLAGCGVSLGILAVALQASA